MRCTCKAYTPSMFFTPNPTPKIEQKFHQSSTSPASKKRKMASPAPTGGSFKRRDYLIGNEATIRELWAARKPFDVEALDHKNPDSFYVTFPFPYMNGRLHLGHAFSLTKSEYTARYMRLEGKHVLWPFAFHCTGMPIAACADKLRHELADQANGGPKAAVEEEIVETKLVTEGPSYGSKKSKATAKTGNAKTQVDILMSVGVPESEIPKFTDAHYWLTYFPPLGRQDLEKFGVSVDWRRAFITTDANPYFDKFVQWQFNLLKERNRIKFGLRPSIFSRIDNQPCADHDRASGEAANPQAYTCIKIKVNNPPAAWSEQCPALQNKRIYLVAATLRPETMYGQTNCFVLPAGSYGVYPAFERPLTMDEIMEDQSSSVAVKKMSLDQAKEKCPCYYVCSARSAGNMAYQGIIPACASEPFPDALPVMTVKGTELLGLELSAPQSVHETVHVLPLPSIKMDKGTGVVTSVPSDSPDDYAMLKDLQTKEKLRNEYGIKPEWCDKEVIEIIDIPGYGRKAAVDMCEKKKVQSWKEEDKLKDIKQELYTKGFYEGVMCIGPYSGQPVKDVKDKIKAQMIADNTAFNYLEPERKVISRSGDDCVVALCNQWYSDFSNPEWTAAVMKHVSNEKTFEPYGQRAAYIHTVDWLEGWACSRNYGLGTLLPWEAAQGNRILIESLSDSTIYFAYYTIAHFLQGDIYGQTPGSLGIKPEDMTMELLNYVFLQTDELPKETRLSEDVIKKMREAFVYWYPMNLRCSGKDLVPNHLTMSLFHHAAIWPNNPELWPRGFFVNGHILLDSEKMSKSTGNFLSLDEACEGFSADGTRIALADAGDTVDDANFERQTANAGLMRLYILCQFVEEILKKQAAGSLRTGSKNHLDTLVDNEITHLVEQTREGYRTMVMRDALKHGFFELLALKDTYRNMLDPALELHGEVLMRWIETFCVVMSPIACYSCEFIWSCLLKKPTLVVNQRWPAAETPFDSPQHRQFQLLLETADAVRKQLDKQGGKKGKTAAKPNSAVLVVASNYHPWQQEVLKEMQNIELDPKTNIPLNPKYIECIKNNAELLQRVGPSKTKDALAFCSFQMKEEVRLRGKAALNLTMPFDEEQLFVDHLDFLKRATGLPYLSVAALGAQLPSQLGPSEIKKVDLALPGKPAIIFYTTQ
eukprot:Blabericola_migrator_1__10179@NODE_568_length_7541_cov_61_527562_g423_i0_p1_GENE_NODE_568_length_7541_cov_61_527562_g423_i0NODE_568_length_7541_cov_61_527562_g423_i0_p1_ORF_typecomplete_len1157_score245_85tRNAsynt_1/PF00133_22/3_8e90tRNAsynt_1g/PF09334_11/4_7e10tRNAsynt_1g/PF09334_11/2_6tRNAsynt_1g/PF09334_11/1_6e16tRNAsynt_1e/PF01406_19/1_4tRNAsynt_1e/PF01406_19/2e12tRNAsynt_1e/PF01406_19/1_7e03Anticodon_1/PF08264_13/3_5e09tRNAsynt_1f/PF01921_18/0_21_NODE_568_length_7541_cov_61_527562_g423_i012